MVNLVLTPPPYAFRAVPFGRPTGLERIRRGRRVRCCSVTAYTLTKRAGLTKSTARDANPLRMVDVSNPPQLARSASVPNFWPAARLLALAGLIVLVIVAVSLRLVPTIVEPSLNWADEIFQTLEPAHRLVYGYGLVTWEFQLGMRSWLLPGFVAAIMEAARLVSDGPDIYLPAIAGVLALLASASVICCFLWARRWYGLAAAFAGTAFVGISPIIDGVSADFGTEPYEHFEAVSAGVSNRSLNPESDVDGAPVRTRQHH
jgi:hypothetical protein